MSDLKINNITDRTGDSGPVIAGVCTVTSTGAFTVPVGPTDMRGGRGRAVFGGGKTPTNQSVLDYVEIATAGDVTDFGDIFTGTYAMGSCASATRGIFAGGWGPAIKADISYVTMSSNGGGNDFGDLRYTNYYPNTCSDSTRGVFSGSYNGNGNKYNVDYITIASTGNSSDFGTNNGEVGLTYAGAGFASPTRGIFASGKDKSAGNAYNKNIRYITIQSKGTGAHFGELTFSGSYTTGCSNSTRGLVIGGSTPTKRNEIEYITIATFGNATDFGDITTATNSLTSAASSTRGLNAGGSQPTTVNTIEYVTIASTGNATNFGDLTVARVNLAGCSDVHGGLG